jgi:FHA domain-containing protein/uncharacterized protein DUF1707
MRASDRDRDRAAGLLRTRCAEGYLSLETLEERLELVLGARTSGELHVAIADLTEIRRARWRLGLGGGAHARVRLRLPSSGTIVVGRSRRCDVRLAEATISRRHVELRSLDDGWLAVDLGSTNGTWLLGRRVGRMRVRPGDELVLGELAVVLSD